MEDVADAVLAVTGAYVAAVVVLVAQDAAGACATHELLGHGSVLVEPQQQFALIIFCLFSSSLQ